MFCGVPEPLKISVGEREAATAAVASWRGLGHRATVVAVYILNRLAGQDHDRKESLFLTRPAYMTSTRRATIRATLGVLADGGVIVRHSQPSGAPSTFTLALEHRITELDGRPGEVVPGGG